MGCPGPDFDSDVIECLDCGELFPVDEVDPENIATIRCEACRGLRRDPERVVTPVLGVETMRDVVEGGRR